MEGNITKKELHAKAKTRNIEEHNTSEIPQSNDCCDGINETSDESDVSTDSGNRQHDVRENTEDTVIEIPESKECSDGTNEISDLSDVSTDPVKRPKDVNEYTEDPLGEIPESKDYSDEINEKSDKSYVSTDPVNTPNYVNENTEDPVHEIPYTCYHCDKSYSKFHSFKSHLDTVHKGNPYVCAQCDETIETSEGCARHLMKYTGETPYSCVDRGNFFGLTQHFKDHVSVQNGHEYNERAHSFSAEDHHHHNTDATSNGHNMRRHVDESSHTGTEPKQVYQYEDDDQDVTSDYKPLIYVHERDGQTMYQCGECNWQCKEFKDCKLHMLLKSPCNMKPSQSERRISLEDKSLPSITKLPASIPDQVHFRENRYHA